MFNRPSFLQTITHSWLWLRELRASTFMWLVFGLFLALTLLVHVMGILWVDRSVSQFLQTVRSSTLDKAMGAITFLGTAGALMVVGGLAAAWLKSVGEEKAAILALLSLLAYPLNVGLKLLIERIRPESGLVQVLVHAKGFSFPSGHAMISFAVYGTVAYLLWVHLEWQGRHWIVGLAAVLILFIGISRIYLGVHWFSDVLGGWLAGMFILLLIVEAHRLLYLSP